MDGKEQLRSPESVYSCATCQATSEEVSGALLSKGISSCKECGRNLPSSVTGIQMKSVDDDCVCKICNKTFTKKYNLDVHYRIHTGEKNYPCSVCGKKFRYKSSVTSHYKIHTGEKNHECAFCKKRFTYKSDLTGHVKIHDKNRKQDVICEKCGKGFYDNAGRRNHILRNTCRPGQHLNTSENTSLNKRIYLGEKYKKYIMPAPSGERGVICQLCGKKYTADPALRNHIRFHLRENVFACKYCGKEFSEKSRLLVHTYSHTGERKFACGECGKRFSCKSELVCHTRSHTGEKRFYCGECGKGFGIKGELRRHMIQHTGEERYKFLCEICGKTYLDKYRFYKHKKDIHKILVEKRERLKRIYEMDLCKTEVEDCGFGHGKSSKDNSSTEPHKDYETQAIVETSGSTVKAEEVSFNDQISEGCSMKSVVGDEVVHDNLLGTSKYSIKNEDMETEPEDMKNEVYIVKTEEEGYV